MIGFAGTLRLPERALAAATASAVSLGLCCGAVARTHPPHTKVVIASIQDASHPSEQVTVAGRVRHAPKGTRIGLQERSGTSGPWTTVSKTRPGPHGGFTLRWTVPQSSAGMLQLRAVALRHGHTLAKSSPQVDAIAPTPTACAPPTPPGLIPTGDGVVEGGLYWSGGPAPGQGPNCWSSPYTVTATNTAGNAVASQTVGGGQSYTLVLPAGSYTLSAKGCRGSATVTAGQTTHADVNCLYP